MKNPVLLRESLHRNFISTLCGSCKTICLCLVARRLFVLGTKEIWTALRYFSLMLRRKSVASLCRVFVRSLGTGPHYILLQVAATKRFLSPSFKGICYVLAE